MITTLFGCNKKAKDNVNRHILVQQDAPTNSNSARQWLKDKFVSFFYGTNPESGYWVNIDLLGGLLPGHRNSKLRIQAEYGSTILDLGTPVWNNGYEYAGGWETSDGKPFNLTKRTKIRKGLVIHPKIRFNKNLANDIENQMNVIFKKYKEIEDVNSKAKELIVLSTNVVHDLKNNSQTFVETTVNALKALTNSNKDIIIALRNKSKGINKLIAESRRYMLPNPYITDERLRQQFAKSEIPSLVNLLNSVKEIEKKDYDKGYDEDYDKDYDKDKDNYNLDDHLNQIIHYHNLELSSEEQKASLKHALKYIHEHETDPLDRSYISPVRSQNNDALDKEYKEKAMALILQRNKFFNSNVFPFSTLGLNSYNIDEGIKLLEVLDQHIEALDQSKKFNYKTSYDFRDIITQPLKELEPVYKEYYDKISEKEKYEKEKYEKEAYDEIKNIKDKRKAVYERELKGHTDSIFLRSKAVELRADRDAIFEMRRKAEDDELQSIQTSDLNSSIKLKMKATARRNVADEVEKKNSYLNIDLKENLGTSKTSLKESKKSLEAKLEANRDKIFELERKAEDSELQSTQTSDLNSSIKLKTDAIDLRDAADKIKKKNFH